MNEPEKTQEKVKVLIVDDVEVNVRLLEAHLAKLGFNILKAYNGKDALKIAKEEHPSLILLDIMMPDMDGFEVCETLRKDPSFSATPIIMVTAKAEDESIVVSLEKGADDYVIKPVDGEDLRKKVVGLLEKAKTNELPSQYYAETGKKGKDGKGAKKMSNYARICNLN